MQEVIFIKNFNKQNQTKVDGAANTDWAIRDLYLFLQFWKHTVRTAYQAFAEYFLLIFSGLLQNLSELSNLCYYSGNCRVLLIPHCHFTGNREVTEKEKQIHMVQEVNTLYILPVKNKYLKNYYNKCNSIPKDKKHMLQSANQQ